MDDVLQQVAVAHELLGAVAGHLLASRRNVHEAAVAAEPIVPIRARVRQHPIAFLAALKAVVGLAEAVTLADRVAAVDQGADEAGRQRFCRWQPGDDKVGDQRSPAAVAQARLQQLRRLLGVQLLPGLRDPPAVIVVHKPGQRIAMRAGVAQIEQVPGLCICLDDQTVVIDHQFGDRETHEEGGKTVQRGLGLLLHPRQLFVLDHQCCLVAAQFFHQMGESCLAVRERQLGQVEVALAQRGKRLFTQGMRVFVALAVTPLIRAAAARLRRRALVCFAHVPRVGPALEPGDLE